MDNDSYDYIKSERDWQTTWYETNINKANTTSEKKFFIHFAYPGVSGYLHVGHMRGFTYCDVIARYKRMQGYSVLFPAGFHASGIPSVGFSKKVERNDPQTINLLKQNGCTDSFIKTLQDPQNVVDYFSKVYVEDYWKTFGFLIDYDRLMTTISPGYKQFIRWQFHKLNDHNLLIQKPHFAPYCPNCGPVAVDKSETDISSGGNAEIQEFTVLKFKLDDGTILPAATLRPETIFGVTNMWINPDVDYQKATIENETWICSPTCLEKLQHQYEDLTIQPEHISGKDLIGKTVTAPLINRTIPILSGPFADPNIATGVVMSVPAHAPYDWIALQDINADIQPIVIIDVPDFKDIPAKEICETLNITSQQDEDLLDQATEQVYKKEFHTGTLNQQCGTYAGIKIAEIKDTVKNSLIDQNLARIMKEFSEPVICRCKENVVIKRIPDQWFIRYSDTNWTEHAKTHVQEMQIYPEEYKEQLPGILDWFDDRAAIRRGSWLGTEFPFKEHWIIEPISDSTLYSAYYTLSHYVNSGQLPPEEMTVEFFDYVYLGKGTAKTPLWETIRNEFLYWYPIDVNLGGKEHKTVHFPVYILNHIAIMPPELQPQGIFAHWWVTQKGKEKISKSKGGAEPIVEAQTTYGVDAMRLYYCHVGSPFVDIEWDAEIVIKYKQKILNIWRTSYRLTNIENQEKTAIDSWLLSKMNRHIQTINDALTNYDLRIATNTIYYEILKDLQWYQKRGGGNHETITWFLSNWLRLMTPFTPHIAEELWHQLGHDTLISTETYPTLNPDQLHIQEEVGEYLLNSVIGDTNEILKVTNIQPQHIIIYTTPQWKRDLFQLALQHYEQNGDLQVGTLMKEAMQHEHLRTLGKQVSAYVGKLPAEIKRLNKEDIQRYSTELNEQAYLNSAHHYLEELYSCTITIYSADELDAYDPKEKKRYASPLKPALYIE